MAYDLSRSATSSPPDIPAADQESRPVIPLNDGNVQFIQLDAELLSPHFPTSSFDIVWISEALSHLPNKSAFFQNAYTVLRPSTPTPSASLPSTPAQAEVGRGRLVIADWVKAPNLSRAEDEADIVPIEKGMLLPPLASAEEYCLWAKEAGFQLVGEVLDISDKVAKTWYVLRIRFYNRCVPPTQSTPHLSRALSPTLPAFHFTLLSAGFKGLALTFHRDISLSLLSPSLFALAFSLGTDVVAFLRAFQAMRRGFANGSFRYAVLVFEKVE